MKTSEAVAIRERLKLNIPAFARLLGVGLATATRWEAGKKRPDGSDQEIADAPAAILTGIRRALDAGGEGEARARTWAKDAADGVGGLASFVERTLRGGTV
jgi:hypothetical protein